jgi:multiple sugar transport system permease protein
MMRGFFEEVPVDLEESAMVDGCTRLNAFFRIVLPLTLPGIVATTIFVLIMSWNEFLLALILTGTTTRTLPVGIQTFMSSGVMGIYQWPQIGAAGIIVSAPIIMFAILIQKYLVRGLTLGAVKM